MSVMIRAEGLGKSFRIHHEQAHRYLTLRDVLAERLNILAKRKPRSVDETFWALRDVDFEIGEGERIGVIGRNGAGKSTLLKLLSRITEPSAGKVAIRGRVSSLLEVGTGFHPELTGRENIYLNGAILGMGRAEIKSRFDEIVAYAEVERFLDTPVKRYSSGMHVRLAFAVAAHLEPELLFVDEVLAVGDVGFQRKCLGTMKNVASAGRTVVFVSHNLSAIKQLCDRVFLFNGGQLIRSGEPGAVLREYLALNSDREALGCKDAGSASGTIFATNDGAVGIWRSFTSDMSGVTKTSFAMNEAISIQCRVDLGQGHDNLHFYARVFTDDGLQVFATADWDEAGMKANKYQPGQYRIILRIPGQFLNAGVYHFSLEGVVPGTRYVFQAGNLLSWTVLPIGGVGGVESTNRAGVVRPLLSWQIDSEELRSP